MHFYYNSWQEEYKKPFGAVKTGTEISFRVISDADEVYIHGFNQTYTMAKNDDGFTIAITPNIKYGLIFYTFEAKYSGQSIYYGKGERGSEAIQNGSAYQLTVYNNDISPDWFKGKVMYQIYTDRFYRAQSDEVTIRNNILMHTSWDEKPVYIRNEKGEIVLWDFFGGNLEGVVAKLDYLKSLGVDIIYLNPIFESSSNHKYDTADYTKIDMMYGNENTLKRLVDEAGNRDMKIILDGVFSHTGDDSIYFNKYGNYGDGGAYRDKKSEYYLWYDFKSYPDDYDCWWGITSLPCVNELEPSFLDHLLNEEYGAVIKWMKLGIAGWRLDVADELPDEFILKLKETITRVNPEAILLGEVWEDASNKISYDNHRNYIINNSLNSVSNYPLRDDLISLLNGHIDAKVFADNYMNLQENYPQDVFKSLMNMTGTHDSTRIFTLLGNPPEQSEMNTWQQRRYVLPEESYNIALKKLLLYYFILFTLPGNPCIYYGDEICLEGYKDPYNRGTYNWDSKNEEVKNLIKNLAEIRKSVNIGSSFVKMQEVAGLLSYTIITDSASYEVYINSSSESISIQWDDNWTNEFTHNAIIENNQLIIGSLGGIILSGLSSSSGSGSSCTDS